MEYKNCAVELKDLDAKQGIVTAYYSSFGLRDSWGDIVEKGAFKKTLRERGPESARPRIKHLYQHDPFMILGPFMELKEDSFGLLGRSHIVPTSWGKDVLMLYEGGAISEHSFAYDTMKSVSDPDGTRRLTEVVLWEGSSVTWGANMDTPFIDLKCPEKAGAAERLSKQIEHMEKVLRTGDLSCDEFCEALEIELKRWRDLLAAMQADEDTALDSKAEPDKTTQPDVEPHGETSNPQLEQLFANIKAIMATAR